MVAAVLDTGVEPLLHTRPFQAEHRDLGLAEGVPNPYRVRESEFTGDPQWRPAVLADGFDEVVGTSAGVGPTDQAGARFVSHAGTLPAGPGGRCWPIWQPAGDARTSGRRSERGTCAGTRRVAVPGVRPGPHDGPAAHGVPDLR